MDIGKTMPTTAEERILCSCMPPEDETIFEPLSGPACPIPLPKDGTPGSSLH